MATTYTTNYNLGKQENHADKFDMDVITDNADKIDEALTAKADKSTTYTKTEVDTALSGKQATLTTAQLAAVNSGIDSTKVDQIETNKNNISKYVYETVTVNLSSQDISWTAYGSVYASSVIGLTQVGTVLSFVLIDWTGIRDTDLTIIPYQSASAGNGFRMLSSTNTFLQSNSKVVYRVFGIKQST